MTTGQRSIPPFLRRRIELSAFLGFLLFSSCAAAPFLIPAGIEFARNLLMTSNKNYGSKYSEDMNRLMMRLSTPYVAMGLPMGTPQSALIPPAMQQQGMNQMVGQSMPGQSGMDPYAQTGQMPGVQNPGYAQGTYGQQPGMGYGMQGSQFGGQAGSYDPNNPYAYPGTNVQAPAYGMNQSYGGQQYSGQPYGQMGGGFPQSGYQPQPTLPLQPGYPAAAPGATTPAYPPQTNPGYAPQMGQPLPQHQAQLYQQPAMDPYQQQYQQQSMAGMQGYAQPGGVPGQTQMYQQPVMDPYQQQAMTGMQGYNQGMPGQPYQQYQQPYQQQSYQQQGYQQQLYQQPVAAQPYGYQGQPANMGAGYGGQVYPRSITGPAEPVALDVALVRQVSTVSGKQVVMMQDGEVLKGGPTGDRFKLIVRTNCECFVYVISVDGSGWAQPVFPLPNGSVANPLKPEVEQAFPEGQYWFTLDQYKGVESFFLVASPVRRTDIEESLAQLADQQRPTGQTDAKVEEPAVIPNGFGKTESAKATIVKDESQQQVQVTPLSYVAAKAGEDVRVTRWFNHQ